MTPLRHDHHFVGRVEFSAADVNDAAKLALALENALGHRLVWSGFHSVYSRDESAFTAAIERQRQEADDD